jgi:hypothetical protein
MAKRRKLFLAGAVVLALCLAIAGYAYWTQGGSGSGSATAGTTSNITVNQTSSVSGLYPGGPAASLSGNFDNPNPGLVHISSITATVSSVSGAGPGCSSSDFSIGGSSGANTVPSGNGSGSWSGLTIQMVESGSNQDDCKGATANIAYTANP